MIALKYLESLKETNNNPEILALTRYYLEEGLITNALTIDRYRYIIQFKDNSIIRAVKNKDDATYTPISPEKSDFYLKPDTLIERALKQVRR